MLDIKTTVKHNNVEYEAELGKIDKTFLGYEDHGIFTFYLELSFSGTGQSAGGVALDRFVERANKRLGTEYGLTLLTEVLSVIGVHSWEEVTGKSVHILREYYNGYVRGIASTETNKVLIFKEHAEKFDEKGQYRG
jgi:hypothetical protein